MWRPLLMCAALCGLRRGELLGLTWGDVDLVGKRLHVRRQLSRQGKLEAPKSAAAVRNVPMPGELVRELRQWKLRCPKNDMDLAFPAPNGSPCLSTQSVIGGLGRALRAAGLRHLTLHDLRHGYASSLISAGVSIKVAQRLLGHSSAKMTLDVYGHLLPGDDDDVAETMSQRVFGNKTGKAGLESA